MNVDYQKLKNSIDAKKIKVLKLKIKYKNVSDVNFSIFGDSEVVFIFKYENKKYKLLIDSDYEKSVMMRNAASDLYEIRLILKDSLVYNKAIPID